MGGGSTGGHLPSLDGTYVLYAYADYCNRDLSARPYQNHAHEVTWISLVRMIAKPKTTDRGDPSEVESDDSTFIRGTSIKRKMRFRVICFYTALCASAALLTMTSLSKNNAPAAVTSKLVRKTSDGPVPFSVVSFDASTSQTCTMVSQNGVIRIPAVRKGLNNQRMRIIQDIVVAHLLGLAVELPKIVRTRVDCGYRESCYRNYDKFVAFDQVFDYADIVKQLQKLNICVIESAQYANDVPIIAGKAVYFLLSHNGRFCFSH